MPFLQFKGKTAVETYHYTIPHHTLAFDSAASVLGDGQTPSLDGNVIIEGDNLRALKALLPTHAGRVKCVYIDPPYNTGNEGWVYNDNLTQPQFNEWIGQVVGKEGEDACRHDKWCCMMYPRLRLLKELLSDDGAIFISIDDNEVAHLRLLMDEVFGEENFKCDFLWNSRKSRQNDIDVSLAHNHTLVFAKNISKMTFNVMEIDPAKFSNPDNDPRGSWKADPFDAPNVRLNLTYPIENPNTHEVYLPPEGRHWRTEQAKYRVLLKDKRIVFGRKGQTKPQLKVFLSEAEQEGANTTTWWDDLDTATRASQLLEQILGHKKFETPKPTDLLKRIIHLSCGPDDIVLDSFAGSGTTGHAVLELNHEDGGDRRFILVQQRYDTKKDEVEKVNICETITRERVRRVIQGYPYQGTQAETILEEKVGLNTLKKADELLARIEAAREQGRAGYDDVRAEMKDGVVKVEGIKNIRGKTEGLGGAFTYARVSDAPLFGEYRDLGNPPPPYEDLAKYIFYTETSRQWDPAGLNRATGKIGRHSGASYYLLYTPDGEANAALDLKWLRSVALADPNAKLVVYCEKFWMHRDELRRWEGDHRKSVRAMIVPFQLK